MAPVTSELVVASWNIREAQPLDDLDDPDATERNRTDLVQMVDEHDIEILALQEVDFLADGTSATLDVLRSATPLKHLVARPLSPSSFVEGGWAGVAVLSRFPLTDRDTGEFLNPNLSSSGPDRRLSSHDKGFVAATVLYPSGGSFRVFCLHAMPYHLFGRDPAEAAFRHVWSDVADSIARYADGPLMVCGDFNASDRRLVLQTGNDLALTSTVGEQLTYKDMAADDVLVSDHFHGVDVRLLPNFSDHLLCLVRIGI